MKTYRTFSQAVNEQATTVYKLGSKGDTVKAIQQKLISLGLLKIASPTGYFGDQTKKAVEDFQKKNGLTVDGIVGSSTYPKLMGKSVTSQSGKKTEPLTNDFKALTANLSQSSTPMDSFAQYQIKPFQLDSEVKSALSQAKIPEKDFEQGNWWKRFIKKNMKDIPLHIRALLYYIAGRTSEMNEDELTPKERQYLYSVAKTQGLKNGLKYNGWKQIGAASLPTAITKQGIESESQKLSKSTSQQIKDFFYPNLAGQFMYTLGEVDKTNVKQISPNMIEIRDNYDMNSVGKSKEELITALGDTFDSWNQGKGSLYSIIRQAISFRELTGYKGFPVKFTVTESETIA